MNSGTLNLNMTNRIRWPRVTIRSPYNKRKQLSPVAKRVQMLKLILIRDCFFIIYKESIANNKRVDLQGQCCRGVFPNGNFPPGKPALY